MMDLKTIIEKLQFLQVQCETANYSTDTAYQLKRLAKELELQATIIFQCCT